nr:LacI family DNA-binding transcriptional regulator [Marinicella sp. W31]MDC2875441.1 LacI family DNA-binding transcriptional regulator [Marinicella sp. W31]
MARITIQKIANEVGLSKYAVSRALAGKSGVSEATRDRVNEAAVRLGYRKPRQAVRLLGVVFDDSDYANSELHMQIQNGIQSDAQRLGFGLRMRATRQPAEIEAIAEECDGLLIVGAQSEEGIRRAYAQGKPVVRSGWLEPLEQVDQVGGTDHEAGSAVARFLLDLGHRNIVYVHGDPAFAGGWNVSTVCGKSASSAGT